MLNRRKFIRNLSVLTGAVPFIRPLNLSRFASTSGNFPLVLSTWDFGIPANEEAFKVLASGGRALDAVEAGVRITEADPRVNTVGYGGLPDRDGHVTLDACIMDDNYRCGSVMFLEDIMHPISVARAVMEKTPHIILAGEGAQQFAIQNGFKRENLLTPESEAAWKEWLKTGVYKPWERKPGNDSHDTIGMIAIDSQGNLSGACTTSGLKFKMHGRVGDSPVIGAALYVDNEVGASVATGVGEEVIRISGGHTVVELMRNGYSPVDACKGAVERIVKINKDKSKELQVGFLALNKNGDYGAFAIQKGFEYAVFSRNENNILKQSEGLI